MLNYVNGVFIYLLDFYVCMVYQIEPKIIFVKIKCTQLKILHAYYKTTNIKSSSLIISRNIRILQNQTKWF